MSAAAETGAEFVTSVDGACLTLTFNRPAALNAFSPQMLDTLPELLEQIAGRDDIRVVVLTGSGRGFCAGADLTQRRTDQTLAEVERELRFRAGSVEKLSALPQITVAAINGPCAGLGFALAAACDIRIAAHDAVFATAYLKAGLPGDFGGLWLASRVIGAGRALAWYALPDKISAAAALDAGFVTDLAHADDFTTATAELVDRLVGAAPMALRGIKGNALDSRALGLADYLDRETARHAAAKTSADATEAVLAMREKRRPVFTGQ